MRRQLEIKNRLAISTKDIAYQTLKSLHEKDKIKILMHSGKKCVGALCRIHLTFI